MRNAGASWLRCLSQCPGVPSIEAQHAAWLPVHSALLRKRPARCWCDPPTDVAGAAINRQPAQVGVEARHGFVPELARSAFDLSDAFSHARHHSPQNNAALDGAPVLPRADDIADEGADCQCAPSEPRLGSHVTRYRPSSPCFRTIATWPRRVGSGRRPHLLPRDACHVQKVGQSRSACAPTIATCVFLTRVRSPPKTRPRPVARSALRPAQRAGSGLCRRFASPSCPW